jgi:serine/threonine protein kinase
MVYMDPQRLRCPCGHSWDRQKPGPVPPDLREICPVCTAAIQAASTPANHLRGFVPSGPDALRAQIKPGDELAGFEILQPIARGGMGVVYKARQRGLNRLAALKVIAPERTGDADFLKRFEREVRAAALLNHPNIVTVYATDLSGPWPYLAMEYVDGIDLYKLVKHSGPLGFLDSCTYIRQAALGLQHAFERGLVHRDIKPHNLMVTPSPLAPAPESGPRQPPVVKILDMGLARIQAVDEGLEEGLTRAGEFVGTPDYAAPEQAEDPRLADIRADLYSLGATWFFLLTGEVPFPGVSLLQKLRRQLTQPTPLVTDLRPDVPPALALIINKLMARDPAQRFQTPAELAEVIAAYLRNPSQLPAFAVAEREAEPLAVEAHARGVAALCLNGDGKLLLTGGDDEMLRLWEVPELKELRSVSGAGPVCGVALVGSGKWGASCALRLFRSDMAVQLWDLTAAAEKRRLVGPRKNVTCIALTPDGRKVAAGSEDCTVRLWTLDASDTPPLILKGHTEAVTAVVFVPDGGVLLSVGLDGTMRQWDVRTGRPRGTLQAQAGPLCAAAFGGASRRVALVGDQLRLRQPDGTLVTLEGHREPALCAAFSADGALLASGGADGAVRLWRASDGKELVCYEGHAGAVRGVTFSTDGRFVYSGGADGTLRRWAAPTCAG